ncbi:Argonaute complex, subunit Arb1 [Metarhizium album ARSEF 1941]|uniref:Argonaute complex, subunit Arb1 n=1 Tax=Metarhizium album (strain ARSEF 1941) TaxID=1081103 RepID=A0A0B2WYG8_METAS|nr:Argonaute complex, subunit Arb1 [Metarhizium album ARSEF 1941]KHN98472.1 Argonaute complex, subunit Arb1 [Metarhizium album ARSEF 1941]
MDNGALTGDATIAAHQTTENDGGGNRGDHQFSDQDATSLISPGHQVAPKKKKRSRGKKSTALRGETALPRNRGTGFEEYFADPPMTPDEAAEEKLEIYADCLPFEERIQSCIRRFRARRRLQGDQVLYFDEYLFLGGIDTRGNAFSGLDTSDLKDLTPAQRREATVSDTVNGACGGDNRFYNGDDEHWSIDFSGVAAGLFSTSLGPLTGFEPERTECFISLVENFLRYVLLHEVCPEYKDDVESALQICGQARQEWPAVNRLMGGLPGCFNLAATELFSSVAASDWSFQSFSRPADFDPKTVFLAVCALSNEAFTLDHFVQGRVEEVEKQCHTLEVVRVERPSPSVLDKFAALRIEGIDCKIEPVGKVFFKQAMIEDDWETPNTPISSQGTTNTWVYLEDSLLANVLTGMKMDMTIVELNTGIRFIKTIQRIVPSFYTFLPQQMMRHYKPPRDDDRPAPSVDNPGAEERPFAE